MNDTPLAFTLSQGLALARRPHFWLVLAGVTTVVSLTGPFGTYSSMILAERMLFWLLVCFGGFWLGFLTSMSVASQAEDWGVAPLAAVGLGGLVAGVPIAALVGGLDALFSANPFLPTLLSVLPYTCIIAVIVGGLYEVIEARIPVQINDDTSSRVDANWLSKLPVAIGKDLVSLQAQDHYVFAQTVSGQTLVRSSLSEAEGSLSGLGMRVHRSWWIAHDHLERMVYRDGSTRIVLSNGELIPVGRAYRRSVRSFIRSRSE